MNPFVDTEAAAHFLNVPIGTVKRWASLYRVPRISAGRRKLYDLYALEAIAEKHGRTRHEQPI